MKEYFKHFKVILKHKFIVMYYCFKCGLYWQGIVHDNSKFGFTEFFTSAKYFQGINSPIDKEKAEKGYSFAWQHHKGRNPHHWEYWVDNIGDNARLGEPPDALRIPEKYLYELVCDWIGAGKVYEKEKWREDTPLNYYQKKQYTLHLHAETRELLEHILLELSVLGLNGSPFNIGVCFMMKLKVYRYERTD